MIAIWLPYSRDNGDVHRIHRGIRRKLDALATFCGGHRQYEKCTFTMHGRSQCAGIFKLHLEIILDLLFGEYDDTEQDFDLSASRCSCDQFELVQDLATLL